MSDEQREESHDKGVQQTSKKSDHVLVQTLPPHAPGGRVTLGPSGLDDVTERLEPCFQSLDNLEGSPELPDAAGRAALGRVDVVLVGVISASTLTPMVRSLSRWRVTCLRGRHCPQVSQSSALFRSPRPD
jgi:hypothetical protein